LAEAAISPKSGQIDRVGLVHENTAWRWLSGVAPTTAHLEEMFVKWGRPWLESVFVEAYERSDPRLAELDELDARIRETSARRATAADANWRVADRVEKIKMQRTKFHRATPPADPEELRRRQLLEDLVADMPPERWWRVAWLRRLFLRVPGLGRNNER
jgi:hypothetical protein